MSWTWVLGDSGVSVLVLEHLYGGVNAVADLDSSGMRGRYGTDRWCAYMCCLPLNSRVGILGAFIGC